MLNYFKITGFNNYVMKLDDIQLNAMLDYYVTAANEIQRILILLPMTVSKFATALECQKLE